MLLTSFLIGFGYLFLLNPIIFTWATLPFMTAKAEGLSPVLTDKFFLNDTRDGRRKKAAEQRLQGCRVPLVTP